MTFLQRWKAKCTEVRELAQLLGWHVTSGNLFPSYTLNNGSSEWFLPTMFSRKGPRRSGASEKAGSKLDGYFT